MPVKDDISAQLDLSPFLSQFSDFLSREKPLYIEGDQNRHFSLITELDKYEFKSPAKVKPLKSALAYLKKQGQLNLEEIFEERFGRPVFISLGNVIANLFLNDRDDLGHKILYTIKRAGNKSSGLGEAADQLAMNEKFDVAQ